MTRKFRNVQVAAAVAAALMTNSAWAQDKPEASTLEEVVVTAQKVSQSVIDVPLSISVLGGDDLDRTQSLNMQDYVKLVPGLQLTQAQPGFGRLVLRGINAGGTASTVGVYVDETTFGSSSGLGERRHSRRRLRHLRRCARRGPARSAGHGVRRQLTGWRAQVRDERADDRRFRRARARLHRECRWRRHGLVGRRNGQRAGVRQRGNSRLRLLSQRGRLHRFDRHRRIRRGRQHQFFDRVGRSRVNAHRAERNLLSAADRDRFRTSKTMPRAASIRTTRPARRCTAA